MNWKKPFTRKKDTALEVVELMQTINNRKMKHLHDVVSGILQANKIPYTAPKTFITDYEQKILERFEGEQAERLKKLVLPGFEEK